MPYLYGTRPAPDRASIAALSISFHIRTILGFAVLQVLTSGRSSSSSNPISSAPICINAPLLPWYPSANSATFPFCRSAYSGLPFTIFSMGTLNICAADASYILPWLLNTCSRHFSPANHAITRASMAEKSDTIKRQPALGIKAVRTSWESVSGMLPNSIFTASKSPTPTSSRASSKSGILFLGKFCTCTNRPAHRPVRFAP